MARLSEDQRTSLHDFWSVCHAASCLGNQACTLSARHIQDGTLRLRFNQDVAYFAKGIVDAVEQGRKTPDEGLRALQEEQQNLLSQSADIAVHGVGAIAGAFQMAAGGGICFGSGGLLCPVIGIPLMAHGANNVYENGRNLVEGRSDTQGPVRKLYQGVSNAMGGSEFQGNMAYGATDISLSAIGLMRGVLKPKSWRLFRYIHSDYARSYTQMNIGAKGLEAAANGVTLKVMHDEYKNNGH